MTRKYPLPKLPSGDEYPSLDEAPLTKRAAAVESERPEPEPEMDSEPEPERTGFNPYGFSVLTVPPDLRREMLQTKLPRLDPKYFQDTVPPNHSLEAPPASDEEPAGVPPLASRRRLLIGLITCLFGISLFLVFVLLRSPTPRHEATLPATKAIDPAATPSQAAPATVLAPEATVSASASASASASTALVSATADPGAPAKSPIQQGLRVGQPTASPARPRRATPTPAATSKSARPALTSPPSAPAPSASAPPVSLQPSWVTPR